ESEESPSGAGAGSLMIAREQRKDHWDPREKQVPDEKAEMGITQPYHAPHHQRHAHDGCKRQRQHRRRRFPPEHQLKEFHKMTEPSTPQPTILLNGGTGELTRCFS